MWLLITLHFNFPGREHSWVSCCDILLSSPAALIKTAEALKRSPGRRGRFSWCGRKPAEITQPKRPLMLLSPQSKNKTLEHNEPYHTAKSFQKTLMPLLFVLWISSGCRQIIKSLPPKQEKENGCSMKERCIGWHSFDTEMEKQFLGSLESSRLHIHSVCRQLMPRCCLLKTHSATSDISKHHYFIDISCNRVSVKKYLNEYN